MLSLSLCAGAVSGAGMENVLVEGSEEVVRIPEAGRYCGGQGELPLGFPLSC